MFNIIKNTILSVSLILGCGQFAYSQASIENINKNTLTFLQIDSLKNAGLFKEAESAIKHKLSIDNLTPLQIYSLNFKIDQMQRIRNDFSESRESVISAVKKNYPDITDSAIMQYEKSNALENMSIDGEKMFFYNAARNLFRIDKGAQEHFNAINGRQSNSLDTFLASYIPQVVTAANKEKSKGYNHFVNPVTIKIKYTITVSPGEVPEGETIRVWMPYPRDEQKYQDIKLISTSQSEYLISPDKYAHKSIYMEQKANATKPAIFSYELQFTSYNQYFTFSTNQVKPYNKKSSLYKEYTSERETQIIFTEQIKRLTDSIIGSETNPYLKAKRIYTFIADNYPWASAREYSTIDNIPQYVLDNKHGDCGEVSLLFITMARYAGIPAKWQSGWMLQPGEVNLHDWAQAYFEGIGWVPIDQSFGYVQNNNEEIKYFFTKGLDAYRYIVNDDFSRDFYPAKIYPRSETVDFQRGEVEWRGENLYFGRWKYKMEVEYK